MPLVMMKLDNETLPLPLIKDMLQLVNEMGDFFLKKISDIHARLAWLEFKACYTAYVIGLKRCV